jgi:hypothetical protein
VSFPPPIFLLRAYGPALAWGSSLSRTVLVEKAAVQQDSSQAQARESELARIVMPQGLWDDLMNHGTNAMMAIGKEILESQLKRGLSPTELEKLKSASRRTVTEVLPKNLVERAAISIYVKDFSTAELDAMIAFFNTPLGKKLQELMPELTREGDRLGHEMFVSHEKELMDRFEQEISQEFSRP